MRIALGSDHAGFDLKQSLLAYVRTLGHEAIDLGAHRLDPADDFVDSNNSGGMTETVSSPAFATMPTPRARASSMMQ